MLERFYDKISHTLSLDITLSVETLPGVCYQAACNHQPSYLFRILDVRCSRECIYVAAEAPDTKREVM